MSSDSGESVKVAMRVRPLIGHEVVAGCEPVISYPAKQQLVIGKDRAFTFDCVFRESDGQETLYNECVSRDLLSNFMGGYNATIFAYGQTGSGKTYTMGTAAGAESAATAGIVPRTVYDMFERMEGNEDTHSYEVRVSFMEIHNDELIDLLAHEATAQGGGAAASGATPAIREIDGEIVVQNLSQVVVDSPRAMLGCLQRGSLRRTTAATLMNQVSSRSHAIFTIYLDQVRLAVEGPDGQTTEEEQLSSKFNFVDLAGSERLKRTGAVGMRMKEGISINSGLLALGNVISALGDPKRKGAHVPFRDSKITRLLQDSLGGNSKTLMIACVSPADVNFEETLNTLKYANRAKNIKNKAVINRDPNSAKLAKMRERIRELENALSAAGGAVGGAVAAGMDPIAAASVFNPSNEEFNYLQDQNSMLEGEVKRLTEQLKAVRKQMGDLGSALIDVEKQRDGYRLKLEGVSSKLRAMDDPPDLGLDEMLSDEYVDLVNSNLMAIKKLRDECEEAKMQRLAAEREVETLKRQLTSGLFAKVAHSPNDPFATPERRRMGKMIDGTLPMGGKAPGSGGRASMMLGAGTGSGTIIEGVGEVFSMTARQRQLLADAEDSDEQGEESIIGEDDDEDENEVQPGADANESDEVRALEALTAVRTREHDFQMRVMSNAHTQLESDIVKKESLIQELVRTRSTAREMQRKYEEKIESMEQEIRGVQSAQENETKKLDRNSKDFKKETSVIVSKYQHKLKNINKELKAAKKELSKQNRLVAKLNRDEAKIRRLQLEVEEQRKEKVRVSRKMKEAQEQHRAFMKEKMKRMKTLEKQSRQSKLAMKRLQGKFDKQQAVLKRRNEEKAMLQQKLARQQGLQRAARKQAYNSRSLRNSRGNSRGGSAGAGDDPRNRRSKRRQRSIMGQRVAEYDAVAPLMSGYDMEIDVRVDQLVNLSRHQKLVAKRAEAEHTLKQAEAVLESSERNANEAEELTEEVKEYWKDRAEAMRAQIKHFNAQIVELQVTSARIAEETSARRRSIFSRHPIRKLEEARTVVLHLIDEIVQLRHETTEKSMRMDDLKKKLQQSKSDLKAVTRQSLRAQGTASSEKLLQEINEMDEYMKRLAANSGQDLEKEARKNDGDVDDDDDEEVDTNPNAYSTPVKGAGKSGSTVTDFFQKLNISSPYLLEKTPAERRRESMSAGNMNHLAVQGRFAKANGSGSSGGNSPRDDDDDDDDDRRSGRSSRGSHRRATSMSSNKRASVFDRLSDTSSYTGQYKAIHKEAERLQKKKNLRRARSQNDSQGGGGGAADDIEEDEEDASGTGSANSTLSSTGPIDETNMVRRRRRKQRSGDVFSRLTDETAYTGVMKRKVLEQSKKSSKKGSSQEDARARSVSAMEREWEDVQAQWQEVMQKNKGSAPSPATASDAMRSVDAALDRREEQEEQRQRIAMQLAGDFVEDSLDDEDDDDDDDLYYTEEVGDMAVQDRKPEAREVLKALEVLYDSKE